MMRKYLTKSWFALIGCLFFGVVGCSTMELKQYPEPSVPSFNNSESVSGVHIIARPLLDEQKCEEYFGVNLPKTNILAVFLSVKNDSKNVSYTIPVESIYISNVVTNPLVNRPEKDDHEAGMEAYNAGSILLSPLLLDVAIQQFSDESIIKDNFDMKRFRTKTIDPGKSASGFLYYNWSEIKGIDEKRICVRLVDYIGDKTFDECEILNLRRQ